MKHAKILLIVMVMVLGMTAATGLARDDDSDYIPKIEPSTPWMAVAYAAAGLAGIAVVGFKNSNRTHLD